LWEQGPGIVREIQERLAIEGCEWQRSTVITLLQRLERKGYVSSDRSSHAFVFRAAVSRDDLVHQRMLELADELCDGEPAPLLLAFAQRQRFTADELQTLRRMIDQLAAKQGSAKKRT
jgi:predicted transcriptional regulator